MFQFPWEVTIGSPNRELMERLISEYPYPRNFDEEPDVDESIYEVDSWVDSWNLV